MFSVKSAMGVFAILAAGVGCGGEAVAPYNLTADSGGGTVFLQWECPACDGFVVERSKDGPYVYRALAKVEGGKKDYRDFEVDVGVTYYYRVAAWYADAGRMSGYSPEVSVEVK